MIHQLTDLPDDDSDPRLRSANARIRRVGTANLLAASGSAGASRFVAQSVAWQLPGESGAANKELEPMVLASAGAVLRYGQFYGPGTYHEDVPPAHPRIQIDEAARRSVDALDAPPGVLEVVQP